MKLQQNINGFQNLKQYSVKTFILLFFFLLAVILIQCAPPKTLYKTIGSSESSLLIKRYADNARFIILDVRTPKEFADGHIANAINIDVNATDFAQNIGKLDKSKKYLVYCRSGHRSANAVEIMKNQSFKTLYNLDGGITRWISENNPVVK